VCHPRCTCGREIELTILRATSPYAPLPRWVCPNCHCVNLVPVPGDIVSVG